MFKLTVMDFLNFAFLLNFRYLWQLYLSIVKESDQSFRMLCSCFRMVHAYICSLPLMLINLYTLINESRGKNEENSKFFFEKLQTHQAVVDIHGIAFILSFISFLRAVCLFNERRTKTILFTTISLPMTAVTTFCRIIMLVIIIAFAEPSWSTILLIRYTYKVWVI